MASDAKENSMPLLKPGWFGLECLLIENPDLYHRMQDGDYSSFEGTYLKQRALVVFSLRSSGGIPFETVHDPQERSWMQVGRFEVSTGYVGSVWVSYDDDAGRRLIVTDPYGSEDMMKSVGARRLGKPKAFGLQALFRLLYDRTRRKKACNNPSNVRLVLPMVRVDTKTEDEEPIDSMDGLVQRAYQKGTFSLTADELRRVGRHFFDCAAAVERDQAMVLVRSLTSSLFEEKDPMQPTTGALLTALFAERAKPADGSKPAFIADDTKVKIVELTRHWKAAGGRIMYDGQEVRLATDSYSSKNQKRRFSVLEARSGTHPIVKQVSLPPLTFLEK